MPTAEDFRSVLMRVFYEAFRRGADCVEVNVGNLHRRVGGYPGMDHRMPVCCEVMRREMAADYGDRIIDSPPSGSGASLTIEYRLPRQE